MINDTQITQKFAAIRDRARLQAHLLSLDAHDIWRSLEGELSTLEEQLTKSGGAIITSTAHKVSELVQRAEAFFEQQLNGELTLASTARAAMTASVLTCRTNDSLNAAAQIMWEEDCGVVPVVDDTGLLLGMLTDRDLAMACYTRGKSPAQLTAASAMSQAVYSVRPDQPLSEVIASLELHKIRRIPVSTEGGQLLGLISISDALRRLSGQRPSSPLEAALVGALVAISAKTRPTSTVRAVAVE